MITNIPTPEALNHDLVGGKWPHELQPVYVRFRKRTMRRRTNVTEALTRLNRLPPVILYKGRLYMPDPKCPGGPFSEKHTDREYVWIVKRWLKLPEGADTGTLPVKPIAVCGDCKRVWTGKEDLCPPCMAKGLKKAIRASREPLPMVEAVEDLGIGRAKTDPPPSTDPSPGSA